MELDRLSARDRGRDFFHAINLFQLALCLRRFAGLGAKAIGKQLQRRDFFLLILVSGDLAFVAFFPLPEVIGVIAGVGDELAFGDFVDLRDDFIHELAIV